MVPVTRRVFGCQVFPCLLLLMMALHASPTAGQGTAHDYERSARLYEQSQGKVFRTRIEPGWSDDGQRLVYQVQTGPQTSEQTVIELTSGARTPAFDPAPLAKALSERPAVTDQSGASDRPGTPLLADNLPIQNLTFGTDPSTFTFDFSGQRWSWAPASSTLLQVPLANEQSEETRRRRRGRRRWTESQSTSPDGQFTTFVRDHNLFLKDVKADQEFPLTSDGTAENYYEPAGSWSPNGKYCVAIRREPAQAHPVHLIESSPTDQLQPRLHTHDYLKPGDRISHPRPCLFLIAERKQVPITDELFPNPWSIEDIRWRPDSSEFTFYYNQRGHQVLRIIGINAETGTARNVIQEESPTFIDYAGKFFAEYLDDSGELIWMSERSGWNHLYLYDIATGAVKHPITQGNWVVRGVEHIDRATRRVWFRASGIYPDQDPYYVHYGVVDFDGQHLTWLTRGDGTHQVTFSPDRQYLIDSWSRVDQPPVIELRRTRDGELVCELERANWDALQQSGWKTPERFSAPGRDGQTPIYGIIFRPTQFDPARRYPVIEMIYAGPHDSFVPKSFSFYHPPQAMAELGFVVVQIDGMGTSNRSKAFHDVCWKNLGDSGFPDRIAWIKAAADRHPEMDLSRVGIYGGSAGGQSSTRALLAHGDFYHVAVSDCGCHDNRMDKIWWNELWMGYPIGPHYAEQSNVTQAHRLQGKLLLIVGELDRNVDPASTLQVANALIQADKDFELLLIPGAGHGAAESPYGQRRRKDFFVRHLLGVEPRRTE